MGGAGEWEGTTRRGHKREQGGSRSLGGDMAVAGGMNLEGDILTGACEGHEYGTGQGLRGERVWEGERAWDGAGV